MASAWRGAGHVTKSSGSPHAPHDVLVPLVSVCVIAVLYGSCGDFWGHVIIDVNIIITGDLFAGVCVNVP